MAVAEQLLRFCEAAGTASARSVDTGGEHVWPLGLIDRAVLALADCEVVDNQVSVDDAGFVEIIDKCNLDRTDGLRVRDVEVDDVLVELVAHLEPMGLIADRDLHHFLAGGPASPNGKAHRLHGQLGNGERSDDVTPVLIDHNQLDRVAVSSSRVGEHLTVGRGVVEAFRHAVSPVDEVLGDRVVTRIDDRFDRQTVLAIDDGDTSDRRWRNVDNLGFERVSTGVNAVFVCDRHELHGARCPVDDECVRIDNFDSVQHVHAVFQCCPPDGCSTVAVPVGGGGPSIGAERNRFGG